MKGMNSPTEFEKHYHGYIKLPKITFEKRYTRVHVVLNNAQMHLRDNLKGFIHVFVCFIFFLSFPPLSFSLEQNFSPLTWNN